MLQKVTWEVNVYLRELLPCTHQVCRLIQSHISSTCPESNKIQRLAKLEILIFNGQKLVFLGRYFLISKDFPKEWFWRLVWYYNHGLLNTHLGVILLVDVITITCYSNLIFPLATKSVEIYIVFDNSNILSNKLLGRVQIYIALLGRYSLLILPI